MSAARSVQRSTELTAEARRERAMRKIAEGHQELVRAELEIAASANDWVEQAHSPLGRRRHLDLARTGVFPSKKVGKRVLVLRSDVNAYIEKEGLGRGRRTEDEEVDDVLDAWVGKKS